MSLSYPPQLTGETERDILALHSYLYELIDDFTNAVGEAIDPSGGGEGGGSALVITEAPTDVALAASTSLSVDLVLFGQVTVTFTLPARAVAALVYYREVTDTEYHVSTATVSPYSIANLKVGTEYQIQVAGVAANGAVGPLSPVQTVLIDSTDAQMKAPADAQYLVASLHSQLTAERLVTNTPTIAWDYTVPAVATAQVPDLAITTAKLADAAVTYAKVQNVSALSLLGQGATPGTVQELTFDASILSTLLLLLNGGTYTPTVTNVANVPTFTVGVAMYVRLGPIVIVGGSLFITPTAAATLSRLGISLPIASSFTSSANCVGTAATLTIASECAGILADDTNDRAEMEWITVSTVAHSMRYMFMYRVL